MRTKTDDHNRLTTEETNTILAFLKEHRPNLKAEATQGGIRVSDPNEPDSYRASIAFISTYTTRVTGYRFVFSGYLAKGQYIPLKGNQRWGEGRVYRKDLNAFLNELLPYLRVENQYEQATKATQAARYSLDENFRKEREALETELPGPYISDRMIRELFLLYTVPPVAMNDDERAELFKGASRVIHLETLRIRQETANAAMWEMWHDFDCSREGAPPHFAHPLFRAKKQEAISA